MNTIIVDDEAIMLRSFTGIADEIPELKIEGAFRKPEEALQYAQHHRVDLAILDISMPGMLGTQLAVKLREIRPDMLIVFLTAYENYIQEYNELEGDDYIVKPYRKETIEHMVKKMKLLSARLTKDIYIRTFGGFRIISNGHPYVFGGKSGAILALVVLQRGAEISNEMIYRTIWSDRPCDNEHMSVYYNALKRLKISLESKGLSDILISTSRGQMANTEMFDCDYYQWMDGINTEKHEKNGPFLPEFGWSSNMIM